MAPPAMSTNPPPAAAYCSQADLGGRGDLACAAGPIHPGGRPEPEDEHWHAPWEPRALALTLAMGATGQWNIDQSRAARETLPGYRDLSYYQVWLAALERLLAERGLVGADELAAGRALHPPRPLARVLAAAEVPAVLSRGSPTARPAPGPARFAPGDAVRTRAEPPPHHSRVPGYARGRCGVVERLHGAHVFADRHAQGLGEQPQWLYTVVFDGRTLWGPGAAPGLRVSIDAWESTLEPAEGTAR